MKTRSLSNQIEKLLVYESFVALDIIKLFYVID